MSVRIRMKRMGTTNTPFYRIVVSDARKPRDGKYIECVGTYDPLKASDNFTVKKDRIEHWLGQGAQPSDSVSRLLKKENIGRS